MSDRSENPIRTFLSNVAALLTSDVLNKATTFLMYAMVSRYLGTREFGQFALGLLLFHTFQVLATAGLPTLLIREVAKNSTRAKRFFLNGSVAAGAAAVLAMLALVALACVMQYDTDTTFVILVLATGLLPFALALVAESLFRGCEKMHFIAWANVPANVAKVGGAWAVLEFDGGIVALATLVVGVRWLVLLIEWLLVPLCLNQNSQGRIRSRLVRAILARSAAFFGIDGITAIWGSVDAVLLSKLATETEVGLFCAAHQLLQPVALVNRSVVGSLFPTMCHRATATLSGLRDVTRWLIGFLLLFGLPAAILLVKFSDTALLLLYREPAFLETAPALTILVGVLIVQFFTTVMGHVLWAAARETWSLWMVTVALIVNVIASYLLVQQLGWIGAAWGALLTWLVNGAMHYVACRRILGAEPMDAVVLQVLCASVVMIGCLTLLGEMNTYAAAITACSGYLAVMGGFLTRDHGIQKLPRSYFAPLLK